MANTLIKDPILSNGGDGGDVGGGGVGGGGTTSPIPGSPCFTSFSDRVAQMWPPHEYNHTYIETGGYFQVTPIDGQYTHHVTGACSGGYVQISYTTIGVLSATGASGG